jgi:uncharacterized protein (DUF779 family)
MTPRGKTASQTAAAQEATARVRATPEALALIERLRGRHGSLVFFQSGGCCAGSAPVCLPEGDMPPAAGDVRLGEIGGCAFYIDADQYHRWGEPDFLIDVSPGSEDSFSIEAPDGMHFVTRNR